MTEKSSIGYVIRLTTGTEEQFSRVHVKIPEGSIAFISDVGQLRVGTDVGFVMFQGTIVEDRKVSRKGTISFPRSAGSLCPVSAFLDTSGDIPTLEECYRSLVLNTEDGNLFIGNGSEIWSFSGTKVKAD